MKLKNFLSVFFSLLSFNSCYYNTNLLSPQGVTSSIKMERPIDDLEKAELIAIVDCTLIIDYRQELYQLNISNFDKIEFIRNKEIRSRKHFALVALVLFDLATLWGIYDLYYKEENNKNWQIPFTFFCFEIPLTLYYYGFKNPPISFQFSKENLEKLRPYLRYPDGLSEEQQKILLRHYKQDVFLSLNKPPGLTLNQKEKKRIRFKNVID